MVSGAGGAGLLRLEGYWGNPARRGAVVPAFQILHKNPLGKPSQGINHIYICVYMYTYSSGGTHTIFLYMCTCAAWPTKESSRSKIPFWDTLVVCLSAIFFVLTIFLDHDSNQRPVPSKFKYCHVAYSRCVPIWQKYTNYGTTQKLNWK